MARLTQHCWLSFGAPLLIACFTSCGTRAASESAIGDSTGFFVGNVAEVQIELQEWGDQQKAQTLNSTDVTKIKTLVASLELSQLTTDHKCGDTGTLVLRKADGTTSTVGILAGHDPQYYEFRAYRGDDYDIFRVERESFLKAIRALGVEEIDLGFPE